MMGRPGKFFMERPASCTTVIIGIHDRSVQHDVDLDDGIQPS